MVRIGLISWLVMFAAVPGCTTPGSASASGPRTQGNASAFSKGFERVLNKDHISKAIDVYLVDAKKQHLINGDKHSIGASFQPSVLFDDEGVIHVFFQARLGGSGDTAPKMIAHVTSRDFGKSFSAPQFINKLPMQTYAVSSFVRKTKSGAKRLSVLTSVSIDETVRKHKSPKVIKQLFDIDVSSFARKAGTLIIEYFSDDSGKTWTRRYLRGISDRTYRRNGKDYYLCFINLIGQVRRIAEGPFKNRLILAGPLRGDYLPCPDHAKFRSYRPSSSLIYSDDDGESWHFGGVISDDTAFAHNESSAVPVDRGARILMVRRRGRSSSKKPGADEPSGKMMHYSTDGGATWGRGIRSSITGIRCLQVLETCNETVLCSTPTTAGRTRGAIFYSRDSGKTWSHKLIDAGPFSYSTVNKLHGKYIMCCYSRGHHGQKGLSAKIFSIDWLD